MTIIDIFYHSTGLARSRPIWRNNWSECKWYWQCTLQRTANSFDRIRFTRLQSGRLWTDSNQNFRRVESQVRRIRRCAVLIEWNFRQLAMFISLSVFRWFLDTYYVDSGRWIYWQYYWSELRQLHRSHCVDAMHNLTEWCLWGAGSLQRCRIIRTSLQPCN